jgi:hypothetical protein
MPETQEPAAKVETPAAEIQTSQQPEAWIQERNERVAAAVSKDEASLKDLLARVDSHTGAVTQRVSALENKLAKSEAMRLNGIPDEYASLVDGKDAAEMNAKAQALKALITAKEEAGKPAPPPEIKYPEPPALQGKAAQDEYRLKRLQAAMLTDPKLATLRENLGVR